MRFFVECVGDALVDGRAVELRNVGTLEPYQRRAHAMQHPGSGNTVPERTVVRVRFVPSRNLRRRLAETLQE